MRVGLQMLITCLLLCCATTQVRNQPYPSANPASEPTSVSSQPTTVQSSAYSMSKKNPIDNRVSTQTSQTGSKPSVTEATSSLPTTVTSPTEDPITTISSPSSSLMTPTTINDNSTQSNTTDFINGTSPASTTTKTDSPPGTTNLPITTNPSSATGTPQTNRPPETAQPSTTRTVQSTTQEQEGHDSKGLGKGGIALIFCFLIALFVSVLAGLYYYKVRRNSYGRLIDSHSSVGNFSNPMYDP